MPVVQRSAGAVGLVRLGQEEDLKATQRVQAARHELRPLGIGAEVGQQAGPLPDPQPLPADPAHQVA